MVANYTRKVNKNAKEKAARVGFSFARYSEMAALAAVVAENEGLTVGALNNSGVLLVSSYLDLFESAVALAGVVSALLNGARDTMI